MRRTILSLATAASLAIGIWEPGGSRLAARSPGSTGESTTLAVLRSDGVLVPFASLDGGKWSNRWPTPGRRLDIPFSLDMTPRNWWLRDRPVPTWTALTAGRGSLAVHVQSPVNITVECDRHVGLQTDYVTTSPPVPPDMQPYPKDGIATSSDLLLEPIEILNATRTEWAKVLAALRGPFDAAEAKAVSKSDFLRHIATEERRKSAPLALEALYRSPGPVQGTTTLYFESAKRYGEAKPGAGFQMPRLSVIGGRDLLSFGAGWATMDAAGQVTLTVTVAISGPEREGLLYVLPLARFSAGGKQYWALQRSGWGLELFEIWALTAPEPELAFKTVGGACGGRE